MTLQPAVRRDPWRSLWRLSSGNSLLAVALLLLSLFLVALALFPQSPAPLPTDVWLTQAQARFGTATEALYRLGLFSLNGSPLPGLLLAFTAFLLMTRAVDLADQLRQTLPQKGLPLWACLAALLAILGALALLLGLLIGRLGGWQVDDLVSPAGDMLTVPGHGEIALTATARGVRSAQPGVTVHTTGNGPRLTVRALDGEGGTLGLQQSPQESITDELTFLLTASAPEAFFAVPEAELVIRIALAPGAALSADAPLRLQAFRSPSGNLVQEGELNSEAMELTLDGVQLVATRSAYHILTAAHNPGRWFMVAGVIVGAGGLLGTLALTPLRGGRWRWATLIYRALTALLTLAAAGISLRGLLGTLALTPLRGGRWRWATLIYRALTALLTLAAAGISLRNLLVSSMLWDRSPLQVTLAALLLIALAAGLSLRRSN